MSREPQNTRPLSGANTDAKLLAGAFRVVADEAAVMWVNHAQRGFVRYRKILENVVEVDMVAAAASVDPCNRAALAFFDFAAAFPSIARAFIFLVLEIIGIPWFVIAAIRSLYGGNYNYIMFAGIFKFAFCAAAGVRQGCPASAIIFVIATDPINMFLRDVAGPSSLVSGYADDIAMVLPRLWEFIGPIAAAFDTIASVSLLRLKPRKCVLIPLWRDFDVSEVKVAVGSICHAWTAFNVHSHGVYLGFCVGPGMGSECWTAPLKKYRARCQYVFDAKHSLFVTLFYITLVLCLF